MPIPYFGVLPTNSSQIYQMGQAVRRSVFPETGHRNRGRAHGPSLGQAIN